MFGKLLKLLYSIRPEHITRQRKYLPQVTRSLNLFKVLFTITVIILSIVTFLILIGIYSLNR